MLSSICKWANDLICWLLATFAANASYFCWNRNNDTASTLVKAFSLCCKPEMISFLCSLLTMLAKIPLRHAEINSQHARAFSWILFCSLSCLCHSHMHNFSPSVLTREGFLPPFQQEWIFGTHSKLWDPMFPFYYFSISFLSIQLICQFYLHEEPWQWIHCFKCEGFFK